MHMRVGLCMDVVHVAWLYELCYQPYGVRGRIPQGAEGAARLTYKYYANRTIVD